MRVLGAEGSPPAQPAVLRRERRQGSRRGRRDVLATTRVVDEQRLRCHDGVEGARPRQPERPRAGGVHLAERGDAVARGRVAPRRPVAPRRARLRAAGNGEHQQCDREGCCLTGESHGLRVP